LPCILILNIRSDCDIQRYCCGYSDFCFLNIKYWEISLATMLAAWLETLRRRFGLRKKSDEYYNEVVRIVRELDRYHGYFPATRRSPPDARRLALAEAKAQEPLALLEDRSGMAVEMA
jgi:hypothetical protein